MVITTMLWALVSLQTTYSSLGLSKLSQVIYIWAVPGHSYCISYAKIKCVKLDPAVISFTADFDIHGLTYIIE
jgi:hypothetical protein